MKVVGIVFADGFEDIEAITPFDFLKRAEIKVVSLGLGKKNITSQNNLKIETDDVLNEKTDVSKYDMIILPGGLKGATNIQNSADAKNVLEKMLNSGKMIGAICASPALCFASMGFLKNKNFTCYPGMEKNANEFDSSAKYLNQNVVIDGNIITSAGVGTAKHFSYEIIKILTSKEVADKVLKDTLSEGILKY